MSAAGDLEPLPPSSGASKSAWSLPLRIVSGLLFVPLLILLARSGGPAFLAFVALQASLGIHEFYAMMRGKGLAPYSLLGWAAALGILAAAYRPHALAWDFAGTIALLALLAIGLRRPDQPQHVERIGVTMLGVLYVGWLSAHLVLLRELPWRVGTPYGEGAAFVLLAFLVAWSCDTAAFAVGRRFGRTRPWTRISPGKSVEGAVAGFLAAVAAAWVARLWFAPFLGIRDALLLGVLIGIGAQVGDFVESLLKRDARHADSSDLIPGHGGVLDRFDSLYFAAPLAYYYLTYVVYRAP